MALCSVAAAERGPHARSGADQRVDPGDVTLDLSRTASLSFVSEAAGFANSLGFYTLVDGVPSAPELLLPRLDDGVLAAGEQILLGRFAAEVELGLFLVQDAADLLEGASELAFRADADGGHALVRIDGGVEVERAIDAPVFFTDSSLNGGAIQAIAGLAGAGLLIGFEDQAIGTADSDYNDVVVALSYGRVTGRGLDLAATIDDQDSTTMSRLTVTIADGVSGDRLLLDDLGGDVLPDGITVTGVNTAELTFAGNASALDYERLLEAVELEVDVFDGPREVVFQVFDDSSPDALASNVARVMVEPVAAGSDAASGAATDGAGLLASLIVAEPVAA